MQVEEGRRGKRRGHKKEVTSESREPEWAQRKVTILGWRMLHTPKWAVKRRLLG